MKDAIATIGENMSCAAPALCSVKDGVVGDYVHNQVADGLGKIGVLVALEIAGDTDELMRSAARSPCMSPPPTRWRSTSATRSGAVERERAFSPTGHGSGKPEDVVEKIVEGRLKKDSTRRPACSTGLRARRQASVAEAVKEPRRRSARRSRSPASCATRWARASRRRKTTSRPKWPRRSRRAADPLSISNLNCMRAGGNSPAVLLIGAAAHAREGRGWPESAGMCDPAPVRRIRR